jgi:L,D-peptidoglycan transpeptidase YkuD (ErfK/YbiS/YcfS/YnhG family)
MRPKLRYVFGSVALVIAGCALHVVGTLDPVTPCCDGASPRVQVTSITHTLALCDGARVQGMYRIRLGKNGMGKQAEGDGKTPEGRYNLEAPRTSVRFGTFVPIEYPNVRERALGYTGSAVGLHGPYRPMRFAGRWVNVFDSTDGCIGLATDHEMNEIATWLRQHPNAPIVIE